MQTDVEEISMALFNVRSLSKKTFLVNDIIDCVYMHAIFGFEVEYDQYSDSAKSCKRVHIPNIAIIGFGNIPNELAGICQPNRNMTLRRPLYPSNANSITREVYIQQ